MIKLVLFDGNGVIYKRKKDYAREFFKKLSNDSGFNNVEKVFNLLKHDCSRGYLSRIELIKKVLRIIGYNADPVKLEKEYTHLRNKHVYKINEIEKVFKELKKLKIKIGLMSDGMYSAHEKSNWLKKMKILKYFNYAFTSSDLGATKIYPQGLQKVLEITGLKPNQVLLVGHELKDFLGAMMLGVQTISVGNEISTTHNVKTYHEIPNYLKREKLI